MNYLLDSDTINALFDPESVFFEVTGQRVSQLKKGDNVYISILSIYELEFSLSHSKSDEIKEKVKGLLEDVKDTFEVLPLTVDGAEYYGKLKAGFQKATGIKRNALKRHNIDIMLASTALEYGCVLVAKDGIYKDHLMKLDEQLIVEDWTV